MEMRRVSVHSPSLTTDLSLELRTALRLREDPLHLLRLQVAIESIISPTPVGKAERLSQLERLLDVEPQRTEGGILRYLVTSGLAVELTTGFEREHHDLDLVIMDENERAHWRIYGTDNVTPQWYWADMTLDPVFLDETARTVPARRDRPTRFTAEVVHPGILLVQKSSNAFGRKPRDKDRDDVAAIVRHWKTAEGFTLGWNPIVHRAIDAVPPNQFELTKARVQKAMREH